MNIFDFKLTLDQVNEIVECMKQGPYWKVSAIIQEFQKQMQAQTPPPKVDSNAQGASANGGGEKIELVS